MKYTRQVLIVSMTLLLAACGGHALKQTPAPELSRAEYIAQQIKGLDALAAPAGVPAETWQQLKQTLRNLLTQPAAKAALDAPVSDKSKAVLSLNPDTHLLSWTYACQGDYDQNGEVNINDLTPIAVHYLASNGGGPFPPGSIESVVDGDGNGEINIADLTPVGINFGAQVRSYNVYCSLNATDEPASNNGPNGPGTQLLGSVGFGLAKGNRTTQRISFSYMLSVPDLSRFFWVRPDDAGDGSGQDGTPSNVIDGSTYNQPPVAYMYQPNPFGNVPLSLDFNLLGSSDPDGTIVLYEFDAEGDGSYEQSWTSVPPPVEHTYTIAGIYNCTVRVTDNEGATDTFVIEVDARDPANALPTALLVADVSIGDVPLDVHFNAGGSTDSDGNIVLYEFDLDGDGIYEISGTEAAQEHVYYDAGYYSARLRVTDNSNGRSSTGKTIQPTDPSNLAPIAKLTASPLTGERPLTVQFDGSKSVDTDGTIAWYFWDFDGDGSPNMQTTSPYVTFTYNSQGTIYPSLYVRDNDWAVSGEDTVQIQSNSGWKISTLAGQVNPYETRVIVLSQGLPAPRPLVAYQASFPVNEIRTLLGAEDAASFGPENLVTGSALIRFDLGLANGRAALCFDRDGDPGVGGLCYMQAQNADASAWGPVLTLDLGGHGTAFDGSAIADIGGQPGILYLNGTTAKFMLATDANGGAWNPPVGVADVPGALFRHPDLFVSGGLAQMITGDLWGDRVIHQRATDSFGSAWTEPATTVATDDINAKASAAIIDGVPAFVYESNSNIYLRKATDAAASAWTEPVLVYASPVLTQYNQLLLRSIGGIPAIACQNSEVGLMYMEAKDSGGTTWWPPEYVDTWMSAGNSLSMTDFLGRPLLVYTGQVYNSPLRAAYLAEPTH